MKLMKSAILATSLATAAPVMTHAKPALAQTAGQTATLKEMKKYLPEETLKAVKETMHIDQICTPARKEGLICEKAETIGAEKTKAHLLGGGIGGVLIGLLGAGVHFLQKYKKAVKG
jgi:hypothetical protein